LFIIVKNIVDEVFQDYKKAAMLIAMPNCDFKCFKELGMSYEMCQNSSITKMPNKKIRFDYIFRKYINNKITKSIVFGGLEPFLDFEPMYGLISYFRSNQCSDDIVIYTGYYPDEIDEKILKLKKIKNITIKFGRFIPDSKPRFDSILGVTLASENQFARIIS
jgi:hypothetical protein